MIYTTIDPPSGYPNKYTALILIINRSTSSYLSIEPVFMRMSAYILFGGSKACGIILPPFSFVSSLLFHLYGHQTITINCLSINLFLNPSSLSLCHLVQKSKQSNRISWERDERYLHVQWDVSDIMFCKSIILITFFLYLSFAISWNN